MSGSDQWRDQWRDQADAALRKSIQQHAEAYGLTEPGELLNEYAVVAHWQGEVSDGYARYTSAFHIPDVPNHVAIGLFAMGRATVEIPTQEDDQ